MSRKERLSEFNRNNILIAAKQLFLEKGIVHTTMDDIARTADYSKSTVYAYFESKEEIFNYIILEYFGILKSAVSQALQDEPEFSEGYFAVCNALKETNEAYPLFLESVLGEIETPNGSANPDSVLAKIISAGDEVTIIIAEYLATCMEKKQISLDISPEKATFVLWAGVTGIITMANNKEVCMNRMFDNNYTKDDFMQDGFRMLLKSLHGDVAIEQDR